MFKKIAIAQKGSREREISSVVQEKLLIMFGFIKLLGCHVWAVGSGTKLHLLEARASSITWSSYFK